MRIFNLIDLESALKEDYIFGDVSDKMHSLTAPNSLIIDVFWNKIELETCFEIQALKTIKLI